jgi:hypothetical protein
MDKIEYRNNFDLLEFKYQILNLFKQCFGENLDLSTWEWAYLQNPLGPPKVTLALHEGRLIGHYAMIPIPFVKDDLQVLAYLSMTTMVHSDFRKHGVFAKLAEMTYASMPAESFVYGFPNKNSLPGFAKRLMWTIDRSCFIATVSADVLNDSLQLKSEKLIDTYELDFANHQFKEWRLSKPNSRYFTNGNSIYKSHDGAIDILHQANQTPFDKGYFNILTSSQFLIENAVNLVPYPFGYRNFDQNGPNLEFDKCLLMSDVF